ncbi:CD209 antigen-like protein A isoform X2 [Megalobrama amblycephala]|uniref:CD209 antigen-like protein A isoform X2 n=1 Tax=Megalobrama amblycephala TaxID=75352 RepID=UPI002013F230|nr:CD209 antigen-like protein A isoform X2 [Megalobrama amblycephala]
MSMYNYVNSNMDRENEQHVYINEESNSHNIRTGRQISTTHQTPGSSGDSVRIRNYRAATVCSVLLCVVLLTALIVLGTNYTQEIHQLQSDNTNLINERDALLLKNNDLIKVHFKKYNGWIYGHSSFYYISKEKKSWNESRSYCMERGADLIIINNKEEHDFVQKNIVNDCSSFWIGLTDIDEEGSWKWVDGSTPTFWFWWTNEPNGQRGENCVQYYISNWADYPCDDAHLWICEKNMFM